MSYDLYFYKADDSNLTEEQVASYLSENLRFNISNHPKQWNYENEETGVYFLIDWNDKNTEDEDIQLFDSFTKFQNLNFSLSVNFFRPEYFGMEVFPIIEKILTDLDIFVLNLQDTEGEEFPKKFPRGYFQEQWTKINTKVSLEKYKELDFEYIPLEISNYVWQFSFNREFLQNSLIEDIFVAGYILLKSAADGKIYTTCVWPDHIPVLLPPVDFIIITRKKKKLFQNSEESGLVPYSYVMKELENYFEDYSNELPNLKILRQKQAEQIEKQFNNLKIWKTTKEFGHGIGKDRFVNVKPD